MRYYASKDKVKEIRNAVTLRGSEKNLYYTTTIKSNFNFFENLLYLDDLHQTPVISPISGPGIISYKYRLEKKIEENGQVISKIKIIPRNISTSTLEGYIWVIDSLWLIQKIELFKVDNLKLKLQLDSVNKKTNSINNNFDNESIKSNSENDSIINNIDTESVKSNLNNSFVKSNSDNESEEFNEIFNDNNNNNNNNLSQFIQKKTHKKINNDNDINYNLEFDDENLDDYDK